MATFGKIALCVTEDWFTLSHFKPVVRLLSQLADEVVVITRDTGRADEIAAMGVRVINFEYNRGTMNPLEEMRSVQRLRSIFRTERPDVVHLIAMKPIVLGGLACRLAGVPGVVVHMTGLGYLVTGGSRRAGAVRGLVFAHIARLINRPFTWLFVENPDDLAVLTQNGARPDGRVTILGGAGIDETRFAALPPPENETVTAGYAGRMLVSKGIDTLVAAQDELKQNGVALKVALYGRLDADNPEVISRDQIDTWSAQGDVTWHGHVDDVSAVWRTADIFVLAAKAREGMPRAMLEAAACARPLVVTDIPGCRHFVRDGVEGFVVPPDNPAELATALTKLIADPALRSAMGAAARERVLNGFTEQHVVSAQKAAYDQLATRIAPAKRNGKQTVTAPTHPNARAADRTATGFDGAASVKRAFDIAAATGGLIVASPVLAIVCALIKWESPGPAIFAQRRVGRHGRDFTCYKLRSMRTDTADLPTHMVGASAITRLGGFLRRSKLDELPQLWNVLRGEMSLVGPRPCLPTQEVLIRARAEHGALDVRPGITGLAQINDLDMSEPLRLAAVDGSYAANWTMLGDLKIIANTLRGKGMAVDRVASDPSLEAKG